MVSKKNLFSEKEILNLIYKLDETRFLEHEQYWLKIKLLNINIPAYFLKVYPHFKKWQGRVHLVYSCVKYARKSEDAYKLGLLALNDKATLVRYRAASLLAYSLKDEAIPFLRKNLNHKDFKTRIDAKRAIKAIQKKNHHIFMQDRADKWIVNKEDALLNREEHKSKGLFNWINTTFKK